jgi:hypothetical protein
LSDTMLGRRDSSDHFGRSRRRRASGPCSVGMAEVGNFGAFFPLQIFGSGHRIGQAALLGVGALESRYVSVASCRCTISGTTLPYPQGSSTQYPRCRHRRWRPWCWFDVSISFRFLWFRASRLGRRRAFGVTGLDSGFDLATFHLPPTFGSLLSCPGIPFSGAPSVRSSHCLVPSQPSLSQPRTTTLVSSFPPLPTQMTSHTTAPTGGWMGLQLGVPRSKTKPFTRVVVVPDEV